MSTFRNHNSLDVKPKPICNPFAHLDNDRGDPFAVPVRVETGTAPEVAIPAKGRHGEVLK